LNLLIDAMFPPRIATELTALGHDAVSPRSLGDQELSDAALVRLSSSEGRVIVTENTKDFAGVTACPVLLVLKEWWPSEVLAPRIVAAVHRWAEANPEPGLWARWLDAEFH
jgi:hypothetical protein